MFCGFGSPHTFIVIDGLFSIQAKNGHRLNKIWIQRHVHRELLR